MKTKCFAASAALAVALFAPVLASAQTFNYTLSAADPVAPLQFQDGAPCVFNSPSNRNYQTVAVTVTTAGIYTIEDTGAAFLATDASAAIYSTFNPANTATNCLASVDGQQAVNLTPGPYTLVLANWQPNEYLAFRVDVTGPAPLVVGAVAPVPTMTEWAMILFGTVLAGGAALYLQRRRFAA